MKRKPSNSLISSRSGFTLVEMMIAMSIMAVVTAGFCQLNLGAGRTLFDSSGKLQINTDIRQFSGELSASGRTARAFYLYPQFPTSALLVANRRAAGQSGDFVVFMTTEPEPIDTATPNKIQEFFVTKLVAYARVPNGAEREGPVIRYERTYPHDPDTGVFGPRTSASNFSVEALIGAMLIDGSTSEREVLQLSRGLADERLFFNYRENAIIVNGEIVHGNNSRRVTNTYNFTVSPRG